MIHTRWSTLLLCGWILWTWSAQSMLCTLQTGHCRGRFDSRPMAYERFDTRAECMQAETTLYELMSREANTENKSAASLAREHLGTIGPTYYRHTIQHPPECWPAGHTPQQPRA